MKFDPGREFGRVNFAASPLTASKVALLLNGSRRI
jgi:hypothetical protein